MVLQYDIRMYAWIYIYIIYTYTYILDIRGYMYIHTCVENTNIPLRDPWNMRDSMYIHYIHSERYSARGIVSYRASLAEENVSCVRNIIFADQNITRFKSDWSRFFYWRFYEKEIIFFPLSSQSTSFMHTPLYSCANLFIFRANSKNIIYNIRNVSNRVHFYKVITIYIYTYMSICIYIYIRIYVQKRIQIFIKFFFRYLRLFKIFYVIIRLLRHISVFIFSYSHGVIPRSEIYTINKNKLYQFLDASFTSRYFRLDFKTNRGHVSKK